MPKPVSSKRDRCRPGIIADAVWLSFRLPLSLRLVEAMLLERGILVSSATARRWALKVRPDCARRLRRRTPSRHDIRHLDEVVVTLSGKKHGLWTRMARRSALAAHLHRLNAMAEWRIAAGLTA